MFIFKDIEKVYDSLEPLRANQKTRILDQSIFNSLVQFVTWCISDADITKSAVVTRMVDFKNTSYFRILLSLHIWGTEICSPIFFFSFSKCRTAERILLTSSLSIFFGQDIFYILKSIRMLQIKRKKKCDKFLFCP